MPRHGVAEYFVLVVDDWLRGLESIEGCSVLGAGH